MLYTSHRESVLGACSGINIVEGDYLLAVNGRELHATDNVPYRSYSSS
jgi:hypothetical protein